MIKMSNQKNIRCQVMSLNLEIISDNKDEHPEKQSFPRDVTEFGITSDDKDEHPAKQLLPRDATEFGIISDDKDEHWQNQ
jgi:hypothetical protein